MFLLLDLANGGSVGEKWGDGGESSVSVVCGRLVGEVVVVMMIEVAMVIVMAIAMERL